MANDSLSLTRIVTQLRQGDAAARTELRGRLLQNLKILVRRSLLNGDTAVPLSRHIKDEYYRLVSQTAAAQQNILAVIDQVAANLCERFVRQAQQTPQRTGCEHRINTRISGGREDTLALTLE